ncbi:DEAD/DEAH box helicase family protein (plasmid) [Janibacter sp. G349]|uniref:DEAD/DEAH box helicase family protein n=1 Tax=Janibacter sp. G349 TaxID=3405424 RepID=UPI003D2D9BB5
MHNVELFDYQADLVADVEYTVQEARAAYAGPRARRTAVGLVSPTGTGKTMMATAVLERLVEDDPGLSVLWICDNPELNKQSAAKIQSTSDVFTPERIRFLGELDQKYLDPGAITFAHIQMLGRGARSMHAETIRDGRVETNDARTHGVWDTLIATVRPRPWAGPARGHRRSARRDRHQRQGPGHDHRHPRARRHHSHRAGRAAGPGGAGHVRDPRPVPALVEGQRRRPAHRRRLRRPGEGHRLRDPEEEDLPAEDRREAGSDPHAAGPGRHGAAGDDAGVGPVQRRDRLSAGGAVHGGAGAPEGHRGCPVGDGRHVEGGVARDRRALDRALLRDALPR